jgi:hypothetical protein
MVDETTVLTNHCNIYSATLIEPRERLVECVRSNGLVRADVAQPGVLQTESRTDMGNLEMTYQSCIAKA